MLCHFVHNVFGSDAGVDVAFAHPDVHLAAGHLLDVAAEEHVGENKNL